MTKIKDETRERRSDAAMMLKQLINDERWVQPEHTERMNRELRGLLASATLQFEFQRAGSLPDAMFADGFEAQ